MGARDWLWEGLLLSIAGMETCWIVGLSRVLIRRPGEEAVGLSWWSVLALFLVAISTARVLGRLKLQREPWIIAGLTVLTSLFLFWVNSEWTAQLLPRIDDSSGATVILTLLLGFLIWFRAPRILEYAGDIRTIMWQFQIGVLILVGLMLVALQVPLPTTDLTVAYFGLGLMAIALTRIDEVARTETGGAAPLNRKWVVTLATTLLGMGGTAWLASRVLTVEMARWLLRPFVVLLNVVVLAFAALAAVLLSVLAPLLQWILGDVSAQEVEEALENLRQSIEPIPQEEAPSIDPALGEVLKFGLIAVVILIALWVTVRSFRRWQVRHHTTPGGVRETVAPEGTLAQDLADFLREQWGRLKELADLRRLFQRRGVGSARAIYANLLALLAAADHPRQPEQTPYEYQPVAEEILLTRQAEVQAITRAYVRAHYGEMEADPQELARLQEAWKRIRDEEEKIL